MELLKLSEVKTISSIGGGPIGGGWTAFFLSKGFNVVSYLHDKNEEDVFMKIVNTAWKSLEKLGLAESWISTLLHLKLFFFMYLKAFNVDICLVLPPITL